MNYSDTYIVLFYSLIIFRSFERKDLKSMKNDVLKVYYVFSKSPIFER